jgi:hypothetical protein
LNINNADREKVTKVFGGAAALKKIPVRYDNNIEPNVASNFSLDNSTGDLHLNRKKYDYSDNSYTSVAQFIDKSISYASSVLRIEDVHPDFIVTAPSSSKYNDLYCTRLSQKTGVEYVPDFFKRNMLNVVFDEDGMRNAGFSDETINDTAMKVKSAIMSEMAYMLRKPLERFIKDNWQVFSSVRLRKASRSFMTQSDITTVLLEYAYKELERIVESPGSSINDNISRIILNRTINKSSSYVNLDYVTSTLSALISRYCANEFTSAMRNIAWMIAGFHNKLLGEGLPLNFESRSFKIVSFEKRIRPFIKNAYVIADKELNRDGDLFSRYRQASFLLFDEDMNSGATLKILADAMNDKGVMNSQITCLVNAYSAGGA